MSPLFTQKHYEHLERRFQEIPDHAFKHFMIETLDRIFHQDNPQFRSDKFREYSQQQKEV